MRWIESVEQAAADNLPAPVYNYFRQGSAGGVSAAEATEAWNAIRFRPHVLTDVSRVDLRTTVLGTPVDVPVLVAPTTLHRQADPGGEAATAAGVRAAGSLLCVSSNAGTSFADIAATGVPWWLQIYVTPQPGHHPGTPRRSGRRGCRAVAVTVDTPVVGRKEDTGPTVWETIPPGHLLANLDVDRYTDEDLAKADDLGPDVIGWLAERTGLPVVVKGVLRGDDAERCADAGAAAVVVSNHGGRQLDGAIATARALPEVAAVLAGTGVEVYVDGGIRRGEHVLAALALGARAVLVGRPALWALAAGGSAGVTRLIGDLGVELDHALRLVGCPRPADLTPDLIAGWAGPAAS
jgi:4-hydroxymandelate oxidase